MNILAVDDDPIILELIDEVVRSMKDHQVHTVDSAAAAVEFLTENPDIPIDCFLLDIKMPGMDGIEFCRALRGCGAFPLTPIVMLTAMSDKSHIDAAFAAGANDYVFKPFEVYELQNRIKLAEQRASIMAAQMSDMDPDTDKARKPGLLEQIQIFDVDSVIDYFALENYVPLLSKRASFGAVAVGFHIRQVAQIHNRCDSMQFRGLIEDVAEAISDTLRGFTFLMAYAGNGTFLAVIEEDQVPLLPQLVDDVNIRIQRMGMPVPTPANLPVRICAGQMVRLLGYRSSNFLTALNTARESVEQTAAELERGFDDLWPLSARA